MPQPNPLQPEIDRIIGDLAYEEPNSKEYKKLVERLTELQQLAREKRFDLKPDTVALIAANLLGIVLVLSYERLNVISTRAIGFVTKLRI